MAHSITFSRNVFIPLTNVCRNSCAYCGFRRDITHPEAALLSPAEVEEILAQGVHAGCSEALFTFGEKPEEVNGFRPWLRAFGYDTIIDYLVEMCRLSIGKGLLPHSNPGVLETSELRTLRPCNASMGLMLETTWMIDAHQGCAGKVPEARIRTIRAAGELGIPFTTGILVGVGETREDRVQSLQTIRDLHEQYHHIQEVIIQNFTPKSGTPMAAFPAPGIEEMKKTIFTARNILPHDVAIQVAPNLIDPMKLIPCGVSDLGGISPVTSDHINPEKAWPDIAALRRMDIPLKERLPIYPQYVRKHWYSEEIGPLIRDLADPEGFRK